MNSISKTSDNSSSSNLSAGKGLALGCLGNLALFILFLIFLLPLLNLTRQSDEFVAFILLVVVVDAAVAFAAHRQGHKGLMIGFMIAGAITALLAGICAAP